MELFHAFQSYVGFWRLVVFFLSFFPLLGFHLKKFSSPPAPALVGFAWLVPQYQPWEHRWCVSQ